MPLRKFRSRKVLWLALLVFFSALGLLSIYYFTPVSKIPDGVPIDRIEVYKSEHRLLAFSEGKLIVVYKIAIGKNPVGQKEYQGDMKTPEGLYTIYGRNPNSGYHKNLGISYPNEQDRARAKALGKPSGGDIKIHGLENGRGYIGKFHRWKDWTNVCIALTDAEVDELYNHVLPDTPIEIYK